MTKQYLVEAVWDHDAGVFHAKSNVPGLNVEAATMAEFIDVVKDLAGDLIEANEPGLHSQASSLRLEATLNLARA